ncbi:MAG TPA: primosomal protein N' [Candidatus Acidoferrales bacterium]|nr:primosomal protein N' [Candidatus Acidoferrales bacterium]
MGGHRADFHRNHFRKHLIWRLDWREQASRWFDPAHHDAATTHTIAAKLRVMPQRYCEVALPLPLRSSFTYAVPALANGESLVGRRVVVPFRNRPMIGVAIEETEDAPVAAGRARIKAITELMDSRAALTPALIELGRWISRYYLAPIGETFRAMLPPEIELRHDREYSLTDAGRAQLAQMALIEDAASLSEAGSLTLLRRFEPNETTTSARVSRWPEGEAAVEKLVQQGLVAACEVTRHRKARVQTIIAWKPDEPSQAGVRSDEDTSVKSQTTESHVAVGKPSPRAEREREMEMRIREFLASSGPVPLPVLIEKAKVSRAAIERLRTNGRLLTWDEPITPDEDPWETNFAPPENILNAEQNQALAEIWRWIVAGKFAAGLLHGVTGSGKTEVYLGAIEAALSRGKTAIVLVPEIALTLWVGRLVRARFGASVAILHSGLPDVERAREWWRVRNGDARVVVGTRSAVFAPLENLGLIIVDEEQESAYKQEETPRYHGRDVAVYRASLEGAVALLGSATPSMETYHNARAGKYRLIELTQRVANRPLAEVRMIDLREEFRRSGKAAPFSEPLRAAIALRLEEKTQSMILINRRGYSWSLLCRSCGAFVQCQNCSIALTYHKKRQRLICHYCGFSVHPPKECPKCHSEYLYFVGDGAERVEEYLREQFPHARIARLDRDTVRTKREYQQVLGAFAKGEIDVLVGTQMVAKGHDFQRVTLVGVVAADLALGRPDFRAAERTFQLLTQVAGRAGRGELSGEVLVETYYPEHYAIQYARQQDYASFYEKEAQFRQMLHYPPFAALASVLIRDRKIENAIKWSRALASYFEKLDSKDVKILGPAAAPLARLRQEYRFQFILKSRQRGALSHVLSGALDFCAQQEIPETAMIVDVDPASLS